MRSPLNRFTEQAVKVVIGLLIGAAAMLVLNISGRQAIRDECEVKLLYQQEQYRSMLKDTHKFYAAKLKNAETAEVICLETETMTAREMLWHIEDIFKNTEVEVH